MVFASGDLDVATAPTLSAALAEVCADPRCHLLVLDLHDLDFIGAGGVRAIVAGVADADAHDIEFRLRGPSPTVRRVLALRASDALA